MIVEITLKTISITLGIVVTIGGVITAIGGLLWVPSEKFNTVTGKLDVRLTSIETKLDMLLEERLVKMEKSELYRRMADILKTEASKE